MTPFFIWCLTYAALFLSGAFLLPLVILSILRRLVTWLQDLADRLECGCDDCRDDDEV